MQLLSPRSRSADPRRGLGGSVWLGQGKCGGCKCGQPAGLSCSSVGLCCGSWAAPQFTSQQTPLAPRPCSSRCPVPAPSLPQKCPGWGWGGLINAWGFIGGERLPLPWLLFLLVPAGPALQLFLPGSRGGRRSQVPLPRSGVGRGEAEVWVSPRNGLNQTC